MNIEGAALSENSQGSYASQASRGRAQPTNKILAFNDGQPVRIGLETAAKMSKN